MAEWKKVIVSGSSPEFAAITVDGTVTANAFSGDGSALTGVAAGSIDIDNFTAGTVLAQTDNFLYSDGGTEKKITFSNIEDEIFGNVSGDATIAAGGALTIAADAVETSMIVADAVTNAKLADNAVSTTKIVDGNVTTDKLGADAVTAAKLADDAVVTANIVNANVTEAKLASSSVTTAKLATNAVTTVKITDANVTNAKLANSAITIAGTSTSLGGSITAAAILTGTDVISGSAGVTMGGDLSGAASNAQIVAGAVGTSELAADAVTGAKIADDSIDSEHYVDASIDAAHLAANSVTTAKIADDAVTTAKIATNAVTSDGLANTLSGNHQFNSLTTVATMTVGTNLTVSGDLTVSGTTTTLNTTNLAVDDQLILLNSGSAGPADVGIIFGGSNGNENRGAALLHDDSDDRLVYITGDIDPDTSGQFFTTQAHYSIVGSFEGSEGDAATAKANKVGNIRVESSEIYIYV